MCVGGAGNVIIGAFGYDGGGGSTTTQFYNIEKNEWTAGPLAPGPGRWGMANGGISHGGKVYCIGGYPTGTAGNKLTVFDFPSATWSDLAPMPGPPRAAAAAAIVGNSLYVFGGNTIWNCDSATDSALRYDIATNTWSGIASMPGARAYFAAQRAGNKIYVFGGCPAVGPLTAAVDVYDPATDTWSTAPADMPLARYDHAVGRIGNRIYVIGGGVEPVGAPTTATHVYDVDTGTWAAETPMGLARGSMQAYSHGGRIIVPGGQAATNVNESFKP
jgi:N-acetylneuraminic acid mutarotase